MLKFTPEQISKFKKLQKIKEKPWIIEKKLIEKTIKYVNYVKWIPGLKMIAIWNSVSMNSANDESDIDLFIITAPNRLWTVRILVTIIFQILLVRKTWKLHKERFCLSFFCTTNALNFEQIAIENDIYLYNRILYLKPILNYDNTYERFIKENSKWMNLPNNVISSTKSWKSFEELNKEIWKNINIHKKQIPILKEHCSQFQSKWQSIILNFLEKLLKTIFLPKTKKAFIKLWKPFWVIINDDMLKFHDKDKRKKITNMIFTI